MWLLAMFDLPVKTRQDRKRYVQLRKVLLKLGFEMLQFSVYACYYRNEAATRSHRKIIKDLVPEEGHLRLLAVTSKQFAKMEIYLGKKRKRPEKEPEQLMFF